MAIPNLDLDFDLDPTLSAQMGFASFGAQPSSKKRRYNPSTDAFISTSNTNGKGKSEQELGFGKKGTVGSGGNGVPLGIRKKNNDKKEGVGVGRSVGRVAEGIFKRRKSEEEHNEEGASGGVEEFEGAEDDGGEEKRRENVWVEEGVENEDEEEEEEGESTGEEINTGCGGDAGYALGGENYSIHPPRPSQTASTSHPQNPPPYLQARTPHQKNPRHDKQDLEPDWLALRRGVRDEKGDVAYYDRSFVEDPWAGLGG